MPALDAIEHLVGMQRRRFPAAPIELTGSPATLHVDHAGPLTKREASATRAEGRRMLRFLEPERAAAGGEVLLADARRPQTPRLRGSWK